MAQMNRQLTGVDTVFLPTAPEWAYVSSSLVREIAGSGGDVTPFLPGPWPSRLRPGVQRGLTGIPSLWARVGRLCPFAGLSSVYVGNEQGGSWLTGRPQRRSWRACGR